MTRITVNLTKQELEALIVLAGREIRHPRSQAAFIIRMELQRQGLIKQPELAETIQPSADKEINNSVTSGI